MPDIHAKLFSPSKAEGWFACAGRPVMEAPFPDTSNDSSRDGSARHLVCATALKDGHAVDAFVGREVVFWIHPESESSGECFREKFDLMAARETIEQAHAVIYKADWVEEDQDYVDIIRKLAQGGELHVEQSLDFRRFIECTDDADGFGTGDAVILKPLADSTYELIVADRKTGYHEVPVERNKQLLLYALGAYDEHSLVYDISRVRLIIHQRSAREWDCSVEDLLQFAQEARSRAISVTNAVAMHGKVDAAEWQATFLNPDPSEDACRYCKAMATCPAMQAKVQQVVGADFDELANPETEVPKLGNIDDAYLSTAMAATGLIEDWIKAVRGEVERRLLAGQQVPGFKLVLGKAGARAWRDTDTAESTLKAMRLRVEEMYDLKLISPTSAEKLTKGDKPAIGPKQWKKLQPLIGRADPKPSVAPVDDKRDAYTPPNAADDFQPVADEAADLA